MTSKVACNECGALILPTTAAENGGRCAPCKSGTRAAIDAAVRRRAEERERDRTDPYRRLWLELIARVHDTAAGFDGLSEPEKRYFAVQLVQLEVYNGGFDQYFFNSSASYYDHAVAGLEEMGADQVLALLQRARKVLFDGEPVPQDTGARRERLRDRRSETSSAELDRLDQLYYMDPDDLDSRCQAFADAHHFV